MGAALLDLPMPSWGDQDKTSEQPAQPESNHVTFKASNEIVAESPGRDTPTVEVASIPQGSAAAELAAMAKPRRANGEVQPTLPAPLVTAGPFNPLATDAAALSTPALPQPPALGLPLAKAGVALPEPAIQTASKAPAEETIWDMFDIKSLPIPGLGSARAAHAAALDMPVPAAPKNVSPFTPAEQLAPSSGQPIVMPGAPPLPANIPTGQNADGSPIGQRERSFMPGATVSPLPGAQTYPAPAPNVPPRASMGDPQVQAQELSRQQQDILMLRQQMDQRLKELQEAEGKMKNMLREAKDMEDSKVKGLVQMYANMKPRTAAQALENMDERVAVRILNGMAPKQSGEILTYTNPAKTAKFTEMLTRLRLGE